MNCINCQHQARFEFYGSKELPCHIEQNPDDRAKGAWSGLICWCGCKNPELDTNTHMRETINMEKSNYKDSTKELSKTTKEDSPNSSQH